MQDKLVEGLNILILKKLVIDFLSSYLLSVITLRLFIGNRE